MNDETKGKKVETQMRMEEKMEVIAQFAGNLAHDFNNHLFVSLGYLDLIKENPETTEQVRLDAEECKKAGERSARLTRQLLSFGRRQLFQYEVLNLNSIIEESETTLRQLIKKNVEFFLNLDPTAGRVRTDPGQLKQAIMNLVANANEAMPEGGELFIETANLQVPEDLVAGENPCLAPGAYVVLTIRDSGCGMTEEVMSRVFEPFFTTKEKGEGAGFGLSAVYGIVKQSGGVTSVNSKVGQGSDFKIFLPAI